MASCPVTLELVEFSAVQAGRGGAQVEPLPEYCREVFPAYHFKRKIQALVEPQRHEIRASNGAIKMSVIIVQLDHRAHQSMSEHA